MYIQELQDLSSLKIQFDIGFEGAILAPFLQLGLLPAFQIHKSGNKVPYHFEQVQTELFSLPPALAKEWLL